MITRQNLGTPGGEIILVKAKATKNERSKEICEVRKVCAYLILFTAV